MSRMAIATLSLVFAGCGTTTSGSEGGGGEPPTTPTTPAALAYVAAEHVGAPDRASEGSNWATAFRETPLQAELRYGTTGEYDGDAVQVVVGRLRERIARCADLADQVSGCEDLDDGLWWWGEEEPEEDPGGIFVLQHKGDTSVLVAYYGTAIEGDPRDQDLPVEVETLVELAADERVDLTTSERAAEEGAKASYWIEPR